jgi:hypothetical protein
MSNQKKQSTEAAGREIRRRSRRKLSMDQSENYQRRSDPDYVLAALREHLD